MNGNALHAAIHRTMEFDSRSVRIGPPGRQSPDKDTSIPGHGVLKTQGQVMTNFNSRMHRSLLSCLTLTAC